MVGFREGSAMVTSGWLSGMSPAIRVRVMLRVMIRVRVR